MKSKWDATWPNDSFMQACSLANVHVYTHVYPHRTPSWHSDSFMQALAAFASTSMYMWERITMQIGL